MNPSSTLIIVPPVADILRPALGPHLLQSLARRAGHEVGVVYANVLFASMLGAIEYEAMMGANPLDLFGERVFGACCGADVAPPCFARFNEAAAKIAGSRLRDPMTHDRLRAVADDWSASVATLVAARKPDIVGLSSMFEQNNACRLLAKRLRAAMPEAKLVMGGANCEGPMARGLAALMPEIDHFFSGESEHTFLDFLARRHTETFPRIVEGSPATDLESHPIPEFGDYFEQVEAWLDRGQLAQMGEIVLPYESSRGCWWGQKHHCTFCGLNGQGMRFREKSAGKVASEIRALSRRHGGKKIWMVDNIMPHRFFKSLLPTLTGDPERIDIFYEQKANLTLAQTLALKAAGVTEIQPGIEALNSDLLKLMRKGVSAKQNIALLRYARSCGLRLSWNLIFGFPGDRAEWYRALGDLLPLLGHLEPPQVFGALSIDRFSPYFDFPERHGIRGVRPAHSYAEAFPRDADLRQIAYHFVGDFETGLRKDDELYQALKTGVEAWIAMWRDDRSRRRAVLPTLEVSELADGRFLLTDTRAGVGGDLVTILTPAQAAVALAEHREASAATQWGEGARVCVRLDGVYVPLATAEPNLLMRFEESAATTRSLAQTGARAALAA